MGGYDVIGDVHGHVERLEVLLAQLGYARASGGWHHPEGRAAVFVGDLIDRRIESQLATLRIVRSMVDDGAAQVVMGNHEFNAVAFATVDPNKLDYCREHSTKNRHQHREFLDEVEFGSPLHRSVIDWFRTLPLWVDLDGLRVVHACWSQADFDHLSGVLNPDHSLSDEAITDGTTSGTRTYEAIENVLKGPEIWMDGAYYFDKDGHRRDKARRRWWDPLADTLRRAADIPGGTQLHAADDSRIDALPDTPLPGADRHRYTDQIPVLYGHYWRSGDQQLDGPFTACVDYSAGKGGPLVAYRWSGEAELVAGNFVAA
jgi:hypothetical protein